jgi:hypothetical protein
MTQAEAEKLLEYHEAGYTVLVEEDGDTPIISIRKEGNAVLYDSNFYLNRSLEKVEAGQVRVLQDVSDWQNGEVKPFNING